jgi:hypothetical protein
VNEKTGLVFMPLHYPRGTCTERKNRSVYQAYKEIAIAEMLRTGVPASITLAQGILESQFGESELVKSSNNHFGIKCKTEWTGPKIYHDDDEKGECFRVYATAEESYKDHSDFLKHAPIMLSCSNLTQPILKAGPKDCAKPAMQPILPTHSSC